MKIRFVYNSKGYERLKLSKRCPRFSPILPRFLSEFQALNLLTIIPKMLLINKTFQT